MKTCAGVGYFVIDCLLIEPPRKLYVPLDLLQVHAGTYRGEYIKTLSHLLGHTFT